MDRPAKRSVTLAGHRTSVTLEPAFWSALKEISEAEGTSLNTLIGTIDEMRLADGGLEGAGLSSAIRVYVLEWYQRREP